MPTLGLGLDLPDILPKPTSFLESKQSLISLELFLLGEGTAVLSECGQEHRFGVVKERVASHHLLDAWSALIDLCGMAVADIDQDLAAEAFRTGREAEVQERLHAEAVNATAAVAKRISQHPGPGNAVEAQVLNLMATTNEWDLAIVSTALSYWAAYKDGTRRDEFQLGNAYRGLLAARGDSDAILNVMDRYPWEEQQCQVPNVDALVARIGEKLSQATELARLLGDPEDAESVVRQYGSLLKSRPVEFEYYREQGWWVSLLALEVILEKSLAYWQNLTAPAWPTEEEAKFLLAQFRNQTRTLWTEKALQRSMSYFEDPTRAALVDWTDKELGAPAFMASLAARWPYQDLQCPGAT